MNVNLRALIGKLNHQTRSAVEAAAANLEFEKAAKIRDRIKQLRTSELGLAGSRR